MVFPVLRGSLSNAESFGCAVIVGTNIKKGDKGFRFRDRSASIVGMSAILSNLPRADGPFPAPERECPAFLIWPINAEENSHGPFPIR